VYAAEELELTDGLDPSDLRLPTASLAYLLPPTVCAS
jgi:hypothetical protein